MNDKCDRVGYSLKINDPDAYNETYLQYTVVIKSHQ